MRQRAVLMAVLAAGALLPARLPAAAEAAPLSVRITSPLGRLGIPGTVRIVAQMQADPSAVSVAGPVLRRRKAAVVGRCGPPYAAEWVDENPFELREIAVAVADSLGNTARDKIVLKPLEVTEATDVVRVLIDACGAGQDRPIREHTRWLILPRPRRWRAADD